MSASELGAFGTTERKGENSTVHQVSSFREHNYSEAFYTQPQTSLLTKSWSTAWVRPGCPGNQVIVIILIPGSVRQAGSESWEAAAMEPHYRHLVFPLAQGHLLVVPYHWGLMLLEVCHFCPSLDEQCLSSPGRDVCHMLHGDILWSEIRQPETKELDTESPQQLGLKEPCCLGPPSILLSLLSASYSTSLWKVF